MIWLFFLIDKLYGQGTGLKPIGPSIDKNILELKNIIFYISFVKSFFYITTSFISIYERRKLKRELKNSPLLEIDDNLTEEIYKNIIQQSKNPDNLELIEEYKRLISLRASSNNTIITPSNLNDSINAINPDRPLSRIII